MVYSPSSRAIGSPVGVYTLSPRAIGSLLRCVESGGGDVALPAGAAGGDPHGIFPLLVRDWLPSRRIYPLPPRDELSSRLDPAVIRPVSAPSPRAIGSLSRCVPPALTWLAKP
eukprot:1191667-Prorocentrum_minimum.AAC.2